MGSERSISMVAMSVEELRGFMELAAPTEYKVFVETGTYQGDTIMAVCGLFDRAYTVEVDPMLFAMARTRGMTETNVEFLLGNSPRVIADQILLKEAEAPICWFLDGHYSGGMTGHNGQQDVPLLEELRAIAAAWSSQPHTIIIDDAHLFGSAHAEDWSGVTEESIMQALGKDKVAIHQLVSNRLVIVLKNES